MKKWNYLNFLLLIVLIISGCGDEKIIPDDDLIGGVPPEEEEEPYLRFAQDTLFVDKTGGIYQVKIESSVKYGYPQEPSDIITEEPLYPKLGIRDIHFEINLKNDYLEVKVEPAEAYMLKSDSVIIESKDRSLTASLIIKQEGDYDKIFPDESVLETYEYIINLHRLAYQTQSLMEVIYTGGRTVNQGEWLEFTTKKISPYNYILQTGFSLNYAAARNIRLVSNLLSEYDIPEIAKIKASFDCFFALSYYPLGVLWENIPFITSWDYESLMNTSQISSIKLFSQLEEELLKAIDILPDYSEHEIILTKNVPRGILGKIYMHQKQYEKAYTIYRQIIDSDLHSIQHNIQYMYNKGSRELIYSFDNDPQSEYYQYVYQTEQVPVITYMEVLLSITECAFHLGRDVEAVEYANKVWSARTKSAVSEVNVELLESLWQRELTGTLSYFDFLKRNGMAEEFLDIEEYQTRFPIPQSEINSNPNIKQNPGYKN